MYCWIEMRKCHPESCWGHPGLRTVPPEVAAGTPVEENKFLRLS